MGGGGGCKEVIQSGGTSPLLSSHQTQSHLTGKKRSCLKMDLAASLFVAFLHTKIRLGLSGKWKAWEARKADREGDGKLLKKRKKRRDFCLLMTMDSCCVRMPFLWCAGSCFHRMVEWKQILLSDLLWASYNPHAQQKYPFIKNLNACYTNLTTKSPSE